MFEIELLTDSPGSSLQCIFAPVELNYVPRYCVCGGTQGFSDTFLPCLQSHCGFGFVLPTEIAKKSINQLWMVADNVQQETAVINSYVVFPDSLEIQTIDMNTKGDIFLYFL